VDISWTKWQQQVKSRLSAIARLWWLRRKKSVEQKRRLQRENADLKRLLKQALTDVHRAQDARRQLAEQVRQLEAAVCARRETPQLPEDAPLPHHVYGPKLISLCVNLARRVGLRATEAVLLMLFEWLGIATAVPDWSTIRVWMQRLGIAELQEPLEVADDWVWLADHSNQIGKEKVLVVLAVRAAQLPRPGQALRHEDLRVLAVQPGTTWKTADVAEVYETLAKQHGAPRAVLSDGAPELREATHTLQKQRSDVIALGDFKHYAANVLKSVLGCDEQFANFQTRVNHTRNAIQQTELAHLVPPTVRPKARFMNLAATLKWATTMLWLLDTPAAQGRASISAERLEAKLGWLRPFAADLSRWSACQQMISLGVTFVNEQGLSHGAAERFRELIADIPQAAISQDVAARLTTFLQSAESLLAKGERLPLSTEILESSFGLYKQFERQHSKSGFTSLIATFGALLHTATPALVRTAFARVTVKDVRTWLRDNLPTTLTAKRQATNREYRLAMARATPVPAMI
jgi:hypothetical protein